LGFPVYEGARIEIAALQPTSKAVRLSRDTAPNIFDSDRYKMAFFENGMAEYY
jgi:hypothetical protein